MIKIFALPSHTFIDRISGVDFLRVIQPMTQLGKKEGFEVKVYNPAKDGSFAWEDIFQEYDIIYFNYTTNDIGYAVMGYMAQKYKKKLICDVDDDLFNILSDNSAYEIFKKGAWGLSVVKAILGDVAHVTCTNSHLKHSLMQHTKAKGISVLPNYIDLENVYKYRAPFKDRGYYKALHFGSSTHFASFYSQPFVEAMDRVMKEYPNFSFITVGAFVASFRDRWGMRYEQGYGDTDIMKWIDKMPQYIDDADFMLVPMLDNVYNRSKSSTKYLEASSFKLPGVYQNIRQYKELIKNGENGYLCQTADEWYNSITSLINNAKIRREMGEKAFETIQDWTIQKNISKYADVLTMV
jgi:glycosyltransferase involved in cell wall biosynthesis